MNTIEKPWPDTSLPYQVATFPTEKRNDDPVANGKKQYDMSFFDQILIPRIITQLESDPKYTGKGNTVASDGEFLTRELRGAFKTILGVGSSDNSHATHMQQRFPKELDLLHRAFALRVSGKTDAEILQALKAE